ncbi:MAG: hypothetical protein V1799_00595 [bacterium]
MKKGICVFLLSLIVSQLFSADTKREKFGFGVILGSPSGFTMKYWDSDRTAVQGAIGSSGHGVVAVADYLYHTETFRNKDWRFYYGPGAFMGELLGGPEIENQKVGLGIRGVFGANYMIPGHPFELSIELGPALMVIPKIGMGVGLGVSFRFYPE